MTERWIEVFDMQQNEDGVWEWSEDAWQWEFAAKVIAEHQKLVRDWNKLVPRYNAMVSPRNFGRPLQARVFEFEDFS